MELCMYAVIWDILSLFLATECFCFSQTCNMDQ